MVGSSEQMIARAWARARRRRATPDLRAHPRERVRRRTPEEVEGLRERREGGRAGRDRGGYGLLGVRGVAYGDGTLELTRGAGSEVLAPGEPRPASVELPPPGYAGTALSISSDSHR